MKDTIGKKIIITILAPSFLILGLLLAFIAYAASRFVPVWAELELKSISEINAADLTGRVQSARISVLSAAAVLDTLVARDESGRERAENIVKSMLENGHVYNAWIACEPEAFDGKDSEHTDDYPGAPSGRFIRSYIVEDGQIVTAPDMDEDTLDDPEESSWYVIPRDTDSFYMETSGDLPNLYDYGLGDEPIYTMALVAPIHRDGQVIGCVGVDLSFDVASLGSDRAKQIAVAVFYLNGRVFFSQSLEFAHDSVDTLGFTEVSEIKSAISAKRSLFLPNEYSKFIDANAFTYFQPVDITDTDCLYLYTAMPLSLVFASIGPIFMLIAGIVAFVFIFILFMVAYVNRKISAPLNKLMRAADAISMGELETEIPAFTDSNDEIGVLSQSLHRMVEQFRVYILRLEQTQEEKTIYSKLDELMAVGGVSAVMEGLAALLCERFGVDNAMVVRLSEGEPRISSRHDAEAEAIGAELPSDFLYHTQVMSLIQGKKILLMNAYIISKQNAEFLGDETRFACILPLRDGYRVLGYVILESKSGKSPFGARAESILCGIAETLAGIIENDEQRQEAPAAPDAHGNPDAPEDTEPSSPEEAPKHFGLDAVRNMEGLDPATAIETMGGMAELYEQVLKLLTNLLPETIEKLDACLDDDIDAFAIEIHGLKGSLNNVGAYDMGAEAARVEQAAKSGDASLCAQGYAPFRAELLEFHQRLLSALTRAYGKPPGNVQKLVGILPEAGEAVDARDFSSALDLLRPMDELSFDPETDGVIKDILMALEDIDSEKASEGIRELREKLVCWEED